MVWTVAPRRGSGTFSPFALCGVGGGGRDAGASPFVRRRLSLISGRSVRCPPSLAHCKALQNQDGISYDRVERRWPRGVCKRGDVGRCARTTRQHDLATRQPRLSVILQHQRRGHLVALVTDALPLDSVPCESEDPHNAIAFVTSQVQVFSPPRLRSIGDLAITPGLNLQLRDIFGATVSNRPSDQVERHRRESWRSLTFTHQGKSVSQGTKKKVRMLVSSSDSKRRNPIA